LRSGTYRGVLFDFDGTITRPFFNWPLMKEEMGFVEDVSILDFLVETPEPERSRVEEILIRHEAAATQAAEVEKEIWPILDYLTERSVPFGVVTNNTEANVDAVLSRFGIQCGPVISRDIGVWKPDPRPVLEGCRALGLSASEVIFLGDGRYDMQAGRAAGTLSVGLLNGSWKQEEFGLLCDHVINDLTEFIPFLGRFLGKGDAPSG
jgi:HAD superfamily hydrolase (TIGR01549 family)